MKPEDFLDVADELAGGNREADWRTAANRAYFAAFHVARILLQRCGFVVPHADQAHAYLWLRLSNAGHPDVQRAGIHLSSLRSLRNQADYDLDRPVEHASVFDQVQLGVDVTRLLRLAAASPPVLEQITNAMRAYERDVLKQVTWRA